MSQALIRTQDIEDKAFINTKITPTSNVLTAREVKIGFNEVIDNNTFETNTGAVNTYVDDPTCQISITVTVSTFVMAFYTAACGGAASGNRNEATRIAVDAITFSPESPRYPAGGTVTISSNNASLFATVSAGTHIIKGQVKPTTVDDLINIRFRHLMVLYFAA